MSVATKSQNPTSPTFDPALLTRILDDGYGPGSWHGPDMKAALADVSSDDAFWRPDPARHNIAEIALHHAYTIRAVRGQLGEKLTKPFILEGEDWFPASDASKMNWPEIKKALEMEQKQLNALVADSARQSSLSEPDRLKLILGITCHAVYHAGQVQLIKKLRGA